MKEAAVPCQTLKEGKLDLEDKAAHTPLEQSKPLEAA
jgi:hypothetical protein